MYACLEIVLISLATALAGEGISYMLVYREESWKRLVTNIDALAGKIEKKKESVAAKAQQKKLAQMEEQLTSLQQQLTQSKMKSTLVVSLIMMLVFSMLSNIYDGVVVANLPFTPIPLIQGISHRRLSGTDMTEASYSFVYVLSSLAIRQNVTRYFGFAPKTKAASSMFPAPPPQ